jgi:NAD(P)H dehydrogenase (quinone)
VKVVVVQSSDDETVARLASICVAAASAAGHDVRLLDLVGDGFVPWMSAADRAAYHEAEPLVDPLATRYAAETKAAEVLVFIDRAQLSSLSPMLKGWLEKVLVPGVAFVLDERTHRVKRGLTDVRRLVGVNVGDGLGSNSKRTILRALRLCTGLRTRPSWYELRPNGDVAELFGRVEKRMRSL